ncbi:MarR family winged helix-turn-helix transcriptional regulator [Streptomyces triticiradicis]|uniref:Winged helix-turn-helix transcriptional regulator n=1 Tax=Streptomyces triticiradicis TaxID=2651189 RepID=A0A7J5D622_9ACTN|nr:MarR family winged helix-turn-helix transcriptional regulator [Streptomyces triticiradicis]KAB1979984.1 winged helix-turn-helix transcriptional regulator [Streptomyces triticiradicis]
MNATPQPGDEAAARAANSRLVRDFGLLIKSATRLEQRIDGELRRECGISHTMLEVLIRLCRRPGEEISQRHLADDLTLTSGGTTRLLDRMEEAGLVHRIPSPADRRVTLVETTPRGCEVFLSAAAVHARLVEKYFVGPLTADDHQRLTAALERIDAALRDDT